VLCSVELMMDVEYPKLVFHKTIKSVVVFLNCEKSYSLIKGLTVLHTDTSRYAKV